MYCPKCGQPHPSNTSRFCSRCGLQLDGVKELLANDGILPMQGPPPQGRVLSKRQKGIRLGAKVMFLSIVLIPVFFGISIVDDGPGPMLVPLTVFFIGLMRMLYSRIFDEETLPIQKPYPAFIEPPRANSALPPAQSVPVNIPDRRRVETGDMAEPPSVTENTTKLFENQ